MIQGLVPSGAIGWPCVAQSLRWAPGATKAPIGTLQLSPFWRCNILHIYSAPPFGTFPLCLQPDYRKGKY